jgi:hypothetical protein
LENVRQDVKTAREDVAGQVALVVVERDRGTLDLVALEGID